MKSKYINTFNTTADYDNYIESAYPEFPNVGYDKQAGKVKIMGTSPNDHVWYGEVVDPSQEAPYVNINGTRNIPLLDTLNNLFYLDVWSSTNATSILLGNISNIKSIKKWSGLDTSSLTNMSQIFMSCTSLEHVDLSSFDTSSVTSLSQLFESCSSLTTLDLSNFDTSAVQWIDYMFDGCRSLTTLDLSNFDTSSVTSMYSTFNGCRSLTTLNLSGWDLSNMTNNSGCFYLCNSLTDVYITVEATLNKLTNNLTSQSTNYIPSNNGNCTIHYNGTDYKWQNNAWTPQS